MNEFSKNIVLIIKSIPVGKVSTYGQIARIAGNPRGARQVARFLSSSSRKYELPWHRVINSKGEISLRGEIGLLQIMKLTEEGIVIEGNKVSLKKYLHNF